MAMGMSNTGDLIVSTDRRPDTHLIPDTPPDSGIRSKDRPSISKFRFSNSYRVVSGIRMRISPSVMRVFLTSKGRSSKLPLTPDSILNKVIWSSDIPLAPNRGSFFRSLIKSSRYSWGTRSKESRRSYSRVWKSSGIPTTPSRLMVPTGNWALIR